MTGGAAVMPLRPCKTDGCGRPVRARGMCINCYEKWRRANPALVIDQVNMKAIEDLLPARVKQIREGTELNYSAIQDLLGKLYEAGRAHIGSWDPPEVTGSQFKPVWVQGPGKHASRPLKKMKERKQAMKLKNERRRNAKPASWAAPLGAPA